MTQTNICCVFTDKNYVSYKIQTQVIVHETNQPDSFFHLQEENKYRVDIAHIIYFFLYIILQEVAGDYIGGLLWGSANKTITNEYR